MYLVNIPNTKLYITGFGPDADEIALGNITSAQQFASFQEANEFIMNEPEFYSPIWLMPCIAVSPNSEFINP